MKALILAGSKGEKGLDENSPNKALIKIGNKPMICHIVSTLKKIDFIDEIAVVGDENVLKLLKGHIDYLIEEDQSLFANILKGVKYFDDKDDILILASDIPMISKEAIVDFIERSKEVKADFCYPIVRKEVCEAKFPKTKRTYAKIKDGTFTGGNIFITKVGLVKQKLPQVKQFLAYRKKPLKLARILGFSIVVKYILGIITIEDLEKRVSNLLKIKAKAIESKYPEIATDVDKLSDLELAKKTLSQEEL